MKVERLKWDSDFFGYNIAQIKTSKVDAKDMTDILEWCSQEKIKLLQFKCDTNDQENVIVAEENDFQLSDIRLVFCKTINSEAKDSSLLHPVENAQSCHRKELMHLCKGLFKTSRYYFDKNFDRERVELFYANWIDKAIDGSFDDGALLVKDEDAIKGFVTHRVDADKGVISLIGVDPRYTNQGVGKALIRAASRHFIYNGVTYIEVVTQGRNIDAQCLYQRNGFHAKSVQIYYHKWFF